MGQPTFPSSTSATTSPSKPSSPPAPPTTTSAPSSASLPLEALDLAAKLFDLARAGSTSSLQAYLGAGIPANLTNSAGDTLLMLASYHGHADTAHMLLEAGADANVLNGRGQSPLAGAVFKGYADVVRVLFEEGRAQVQGEGAGHPDAVQTARMFRRGDFLELFGVREVDVEV